jgi:hypothetical protein
LYAGGNPDYRPVNNIIFDSNVIRFPETAAPDTDEHVGFRIITDVYDAVNFPEGFVQGLVLNNNTFTNYNVGVYSFYGGGAVTDAQISNNTFIAKPFTTSGFSAGTTLNTRAVLQNYQSGAGATLTALRYMSFTGNRVYGATYLFATQTGAGSSSSYFLPEQISGNRFDYVKNIKTADVRPLTTANRFSNNVGVDFLDRTWNGSNIGNSLRVTGVSDSDLRFNFIWSGTELNFYTDDSGTKVRTALLENTQTFTGVNRFPSIELSDISGSVGTRVRNQCDNVLVSGVATTILSSGPAVGGLVIVNGIDTGGNNRFCDLVMASTTTNPTVIQSFTSWGSPAARTYTRSGSALQLAMASSTYDVKAMSFSS